MSSQDHPILHRNTTKVLRDELAAKIGRKDPLIMLLQGAEPTRSSSSADAAAMVLASQLPQEKISR